jgi:putative DNA methylase
MEYKKKLIEVDLPLNEINEASSREKSLRHGHPSTLHLWWARRPTATARAVLFAQLVDDPSSHPELFPTEEAQKTERDRLFKIIKKLSVWENSNDTYLLSEAISEIKKYVPDFDTLKVLDPFSGGGTIPLEGQRLGMTPICHDLNPVALTIEKAMVDIPARFQNGPAINPESRQKKLDNVWNGTIGLATDIEYYGKLLRKLTEEKIGNLYPKVNVNGELLTPIGYLWARTIECPNPGCKKQIPLVKSFNLSVVKGKECSWYPVLQENGDWIPTIKNRLADKEIEATVGNGKVTCPFCHGTIDCEKACSGEEKIKERLCCIILDSKSSRLDSYYQKPLS